MTIDPAAAAQDLRRARVAFAASIVAMTLMPLAVTGTNLAFPEIEATFAAGLPDIGVTVMTAADDLTYTLVYEDIDNDQRFWNALSALVLFAAALAAFNLINRIVEAQRREIGIGMALATIGIAIPRRAARR